MADLTATLNSLTGANRDAYAALSNLFSSYGLDSLSPTILGYLQQGFSADTISVLLQNSPEYQARFSGNQARIDNGLAVLTPAEYLSTEASYRQLLQSAGLDNGFMNSDTYAEWIGMDISPAEIQSRVNLAVQATVNSDQYVQDALSQWGIQPKDLVSYFLNDSVPMPELQQTMQRAQIMGAGGQSGIQVDMGDATRWAQEGVTYQQAQLGFKQVAAVLPMANELSQIYYQSPEYRQGDAEAEFLTNDGTSKLQREDLARQEMANFQGQGGVGQKSFTQNNLGVA